MPPSTSIPTIAISMGDPGGIGSEVLVKALADDALRARARIMILGVDRVMREAAVRAAIEPFWITKDAPCEPESRPSVIVLDEEIKRIDPAPTGEGGRLSFAWVERAIAMAMKPTSDALRAHAIVTGPISKEAWKLAGHGEFPGHTELLAARTGAKRYGMMFVSPVLRAILVTAHVPLVKVASMLSVDRVLESIRLGREACREMGMTHEPRIAVCGLNPHAGESGMLGDEEAGLIAPAIERARQEGIDARGPMPGDTVWASAATPPLGRGDFDLVVAMYHDQALAPLKLVAWREAVNVTVGLPIVRTSPDHGTAFDIAGKNQADAGSMKAAIELAIQMAQRRMAREAHHN